MAKKVFAHNFVTLHEYIVADKTMPTILRIKGYRFFFYINDHTPAHIHIEKDDCTAKFYLEPVELQRSKKFNAKELNELRKIVIEYHELLINKWYEYFNNK